MRLELNTNEIIADMTAKSRVDCEMMDPDTRYHTEVGTEKMDEVKRIMTQVQARFERMINNFLQRAWQSEASNELGLPEYIIYDLAISDRRGSNKLQAMADLIHEYYVTYMLAKYYAGRGAQDLSNTYSLSVADTVKDFESLIYSKIAP